MSTLTDFDRQTLTIEQQKALIDLEHSQQVAQMYVADAETRAVTAEAADGVDVGAARAALAEELLRADVAHTRRRTRAFKAYIAALTPKHNDATQGASASDDAGPNSGGSLGSSYEGDDKDDEEELLDGTYGL